MTRFRFLPALFNITSLFALTGCGVADPDNASQAPKAVVTLAAPPPAATATPSAAASSSSKPAVESNSPSVGAAVSCEKTEDGFSSFFNIFVFDGKTRAAHTAQTVEVVAYSNPSKVLGRETAEQVEPFKVGLSDNMWSFMSNGLADDKVPERVELTMHLHGDAMRVDFVKAEYAPDDDLIRTYGQRHGYVFKHTDGCWQLAQELR